MSSKTLSSKVRIRTSELPPEASRRYGFLEDHPELDLSRTSVDRRQDQHLKDDVTNALYRLELDSVKPGVDVLSQTGFRKVHHLRKRSPGDELTLLAASSAASPGAREKRTVRPYSYVEPRVLRQHLSADRAVEIKDSVGSRGSAASTAWHHAQPAAAGYSVHRSVYPAREPLGGSGVVLSEYRDSASAPLGTTHRYSRWSVYGSTPSSWTRSQSTPPDRYERSTSQVIRQPIFGSHLAPRKNREYSIGVKLAESQTELNSFNRLLEKTFRGGSSYGAYRPPLPPPPLYSSDYYDYLGPKTRYEFNEYSPPTKVTRPTERSLVYGYSDYGPYSSRYSSKYLPSLNNYNDYYRSEGLRYEPWYLPYYSRGGYYSAGNYLSPSVGRYTTKYLY